jgi:predicted dehydrogenase
MTVAEKVKVGVIGSRFEADIHVASITQMGEDVEVVAIASPTPGNAEKLAKHYGVPRWFTDYRTMLAEPDIEMVTITAPNRLHCQMTIDIANAGKHVVCEKPLCLTVAEADQIIRTAAANDRVLTVYQNRRWDPDFVAVRRAVETGLLGDVFNVETFVGGFEHPCRTWHSDTAVSGGAGYDWGSHHVDWVLMLLGGMPRVVQAHGHKRVWHDVTNVDQLRVRMTWGDGREAEFFQSDIAAVRRPKFYVQGTAGTLVGAYRTITLERIEPGRGYVATQAHHAEAPADLMLARYEGGAAISETRLPPAPEQPFAFHQNLADHLHLGEPLAVTPASVRHVVAVLEAAQRSLRNRGELEAVHLERRPTEVAA